MVIPVHETILLAIDNVSMLSAWIKEVSMFTNSERKQFDNSYIVLLREEDRYIEVKSKSTSHCWIIFKKSFDSGRPVTIYHKHNQSDKYYHKNYETYNVAMAVSSIKSHDKYILNGKGC